MNVNDIFGVSGTNLSSLESKKTEAAEQVEKLGLNISKLQSDDFISTTATGVQDLKEENAGEIDNASEMSPEELNELLNKYNQEIEQLEADIEEYDKDIENAEAQLRTEQLILTKNQGLLNDTQTEIADLSGEYESTQESYEAIMTAIKNATESAEEQAKKTQQNAIYEAMANYNEEEDGDYNAYLKESLTGIMADDSINTLIEGLQGQSADLMNKLGSIQSNIESKTSVAAIYENQVNITQANITTLEDKINNTNSLKATANLQIENTTAKIGTAILSQISDEEKALVSANGINLAETFEDGSPKYIIAPGKQDNKLHIYEMDGPNSCSATTLARKYAPNCGFDIVPSGNGYMNGLSCAQDCSGSTVYNLTCVSDDLKSCKFDSRNMSYCTCSPLSFDINGDGVKTSDELVKFDIDGDGQIDTINDSADAVLVFDADGDGISGENGLECFGDNTDLDGDGKADGFSNGFDALKALAKKENLINGVDDNKLDENDLKVLEEKYGLKIKTGGYNSQASSLFDAGITEINLAKTDEVNLKKDFDGNQNDLMTQEGATFVVNGKEREYADLWHSKKDEQS